MRSSGNIYVADSIPDGGKSNNIHLDPFWIMSMADRKGVLSPEDDGSGPLEFNWPGARNYAPEVEEGYLRM